VKHIRHDLRTWRFWRRLLTNFFAAVGAIVVLLEVFNFAFPNALSLRGLGLVLVTAVSSAIYGLARAWPKPIDQTYNSPNTRIRIIEGDLFDQDIHLVIGTCDTFDTAVPNIIARESIQGQALDRLFGGDVGEMDKHLAEALDGTPIAGTIQKPGKQEKYGIGAIATIKQSGRRLFIVAYSEMNIHNEAQSTADGIWKSLLTLWDEVSRQGNGGAVAIPVLGGGQSRISQVMPAQDSIRVIALSFMFASRRKRICDELRIVVRSADYERLDRLELQAFLSSLRPS
jgi:hypothetical protein